ncbi:rho GTPase-activating protein 25-like isoform X1 [Asterias rubens]|uniref:rho GTPase-activating protein 25-like isoform X1 n=1 Tax=Asterias rubens TaxID=7604 RepID=UPI001455D265|nr:rho GTPase-activating protein 25-like isoform X1 [Asterias rubens]XP_033644157.1 rho GTPase-activating protein 25-like isoform X1 [Asterias rubens]
MTDLRRFMCQDTNYSGWLMNRSSHGLNIFRHWHRSWFILADGHLHYFKHQGSIPLHGCRLTSRTSNNGDNEPLGYVLEIHPERKAPTKRGTPNEKHNSDSKKGGSHGSPSKPFLVCSSTLMELEHWQREIRRVRGGVFGQSLEDTIINESDSCTKVIPTVVELCVNYIRNNGLREEGIFRLNGRSCLVQELQDAFDKGERPSFDEANAGIHTIASLLKRYFQLLPEPIIPWRHCKYFIPVMQYLQENEDEGRHKLIIQLALLPRINYNLLKYLCQFLHDVHRQEAFNKMGLGNLANIFAPHILRPKHAQGAFLLGSTALSLRLVHYLINHQDKLFPPTSDILMDYEVIEAPPSSASPMSSFDSTGSLYERASSCEYEVEIIPRFQENGKDWRGGDGQEKKHSRIQKTESCNYELELFGEEYGTPADVNSIYENLDLSSGPSLIESLKNRISEMPNKPPSQNEQKAKRYGVSYRDPASFGVIANGPRRHSSDNPHSGKVNGSDGPMLRGKKHKFQNGDVHSQVQSTYQNVKSLAIAIKEQSPDTCNGANAYQNPNPLHTALIRDLKAATTSEDDYLQPIFVKQSTRTNGEALKPPPKTAVKTVFNSDTTKPRQNQVQRSGTNEMNGKPSTSAKPIPSGDTMAPSQGLRARLRQKEEEIGRQQKTLDKIKKERESLRVKLCAEEAARNSTEERNRQLQLEIDSLKRRLGIR